MGTLRCPPIVESCAHTLSTIPQQLPSLDVVGVAHSKGVHRKGLTYNRVCVGCALRVPGLGVQLRSQHPGNYDGLLS